MSLNTKVKLFKWISILEGISFLVLLFIAMPFKYFLDMPAMVQQVGRAHGFLFIAYVAGVFLLFKKLDWNFKEILIILGCSLIPFGPFYMEKKFLP